MSRYVAAVLVSLVALMSALALAQTPGTPSVQNLLIFNGVVNGGQPWAAPILDQAGNLYGATSEGGNGNCSEGKWTYGCGTVFKLSPPESGSKQWTETLLYQFQNSADGNYPAGGLVFDKSGNLYGTTYRGGPSATCGTVFQLTPPASGSGPWTKNILHNFTCGSDGGFPESGLVFDKVGNLYGTTTLGGNCNLTFGCAGDPWTETVLYAFNAGTDGFEPQSTPLFDAAGNLYGTTILGGSSAGCGLDEGCGTIFQLTPPSSSGGAWTEKILHTFGTQAGDGWEPRSGLVFAKPGVFYGVTEGGGDRSLGTVYQLTAPSSSGGNWTVSVLYSFTGVDGLSPFGAPTLASNGTIYGLTSFGGSSERGNIFQLTPPVANGDPWTETSLYQFNSFAYPLGGLTLGKGGWLYGVTLGNISGGLTCATSSTGQNRQCGEVFRVLP